eukprot:SM000041S15507  [mRNA]  locus=s41:560564:566278:+ [translate_table: standard]
MAMAAAAQQLLQQLSSPTTAEPLSRQAGPRVGLCARMQSRDSGRAPLGRTPARTPFLGDAAKLCQAAAARLLVAQRRQSGKARPVQAVAAAAAVIGNPRSTTEGGGPTEAVRQAPKKGGGGAGGRRRVKARRLTQANSELPHVAKLEWLKQEGVNLTSESLVEEGELASKSVDGLLRLQRTIWRVNRAIARCESVREALGVVEEMKASGMNAANEGTYVALITVCRRQRQGERALVVYEAMKQAGVQPGLLTYNTLLSCCQQAQRLEDAFRLKADMEGAGVKPDVVTYTSLMAIVVKVAPVRGRSSFTQRFERAMQLFAEMQMACVQPDAVTFNTLMYAGAQAKLPGKVLEIYAALMAAGAQPNQNTFGILLDAVGQGGRLKAALGVFNEMKAMGVSPTLATYNTLIDACGAAAQPDVDRAWALLGEMKAAGIEPTVATFASLITTACKGADHISAMKAYALLKELGDIKPLTGSLYNKLMHSASVAGSTELSFELYAEMRECGHLPDETTYSTLVAACTRDNDLPRALMVSQEMEGLGVVPNQVVYNALIGAYGRAGEWQEAVATFRILQEECKAEPLSSLSFSIVFDACFGPDGVDVAVAGAAAHGERLAITQGMEVAMGIYREGIALGIFKKVDPSDLSRCDVRGMTKATLAVAILAWLEDVRASPPTANLVIVTGKDSGRGMLGQRHGRFPKLRHAAGRALTAMGLRWQALDALTMQALTVEQRWLQAWLGAAAPEATAASAEAPSSSAGAAVANGTLTTAGS